jgi:hypothetical protein
MKEEISVSLSGSSYRPVSHVRYKTLKGDLDIYFQWRDIGHIHSSNYELRTRVWAHRLFKSQEIFSEDRSTWMSYLSFKDTIRDKEFFNDVKDPNLRAILNSALHRTMDALDDYHPKEEDVRDKSTLSGTRREVARKFDRVFGSNLEDVKLAESLVKFEKVVSDKMDILKDNVDSVLESLGSIKEEIHDNVENMSVLENGLVATFLASSTLSTALLSTAVVMDIQNKSEKVLIDKPQKQSKENESEKDKSDTSYAFYKLIKDEGSLEK